MGRRGLPGVLGKELSLNLSMKGGEGRGAGEVREWDGECRAEGQGKQGIPPYPGLVI